MKWKGPSAPAAAVVDPGSNPATLEAIRPAAMATVKRTAEELLADSLRNAEEVPERAELEYVPFEEC